MKTIAIAVLLTVLAAGPARADASFDCPVPTGWSASQEDTALRLSGPSDKNGLSAFIVVRRYPPEQKSFANADAYMKTLMEKPLYEAPGTKIGPATATVVAGRKAQAFIKDGVAYVPPSRMDTKEIPTREEHVVVPAAKGFYVLMYYAPTSLFAKNRAAFKKVLSGFKPKL